MINNIVKSEHIKLFALLVLSSILNNKIEKGKKISLKLLFQTGLKLNRHNVVEVPVFPGGTVALYN
jgi:hypothetical protein